LKADRLNGRDSCPVCLSPIDSEKRHHIKDHFLDEVEKGRKECDEAQGAIKILNEEIEGLNQKKKSGADLAQANSKKLFDLRSFVQIDTAELSKWQTLQSTNERIQESIVEKELKIDEAEKWIEDLKIVVKLFSAEGVPANLVRLVVPTLEELSNELLKKLTQGQFQIQIRTGGGGQRETFEVDILDGTYTRPYETYSGGEQFRINFAVRVALSLLLSRMRGATSRCLFIDEGFGSQDEEGRKLLAECIIEIKEYFDSILVITHMEDLRDSFPVKFEAVPFEEGSIIQRVI
jgi:exonuclease SbcC